MDEFAICIDDSVEGISKNVIDNVANNVWVDAKDMSIEDGVYDMYPKARQYALDLTEKELMQAVEGMYHNLEIWA